MVFVLWSSPNHTLIKYRGPIKKIILTHLSPSVNWHKIYLPWGIIFLVFQIWGLLKPQTTSTWFLLYCGGFSPWQKTGVIPLLLNFIRWWQWLLGIESPKISGQRRENDQCHRLFMIWRSKFVCRYGTYPMSCKGQHTFEKTSFENGVWWATIEEF
jgi:hypothetical protein